VGRADVSVTIARPVEDVFAVLTDPTQSPRWSANAIEAELITPGPPGIGSRRRAVAKGPFGGTMENVMEVTELDPNRKVALKLISAPWGGTGRTWYTFTPVEGGTRARLLRGYPQLHDPHAVRVVGPWDENGRSGGSDSTGRSRPT
jgi:uncharacterized protein YndB with AHSA1/START domain